MGIFMPVSGLKTKKMVKVWKIFQTENHTQAFSKMERGAEKESKPMPIVQLSKEYSKMTISGQVKELFSMMMETLILVNSKAERRMVKES